MRINKTCETCEFNFEGVCTGEGNYSYGQKIQDFNKECDGWGISFDYFTEITEKMPWYIKDAYDRGKIYFEDALRKLEEDETPKGTQINIYDAIAKVYNIPWWELGEILGVKTSVIGYAVCRGTIPKRKKQFATILCIPEGYFDAFYSHQLADLEKCKNEFYAHYGNEWIMKMRELARRKIKD